jgi:beta-N-acetylhexosaminidase
MHRLFNPASGLAAVVAAGFLLLACGHHPAPQTAATPAPARGAPGGRSPAGGPPAPQARDPWGDSVLATLSLRQKAAQMVWPNLLGDYTPTDAVAWRKLVHLVTDEGVGGLLISIGSPEEIASRLNALQHAAVIPLLVSSDFEYGAGERARGGYFLPNAIDLGGATIFPPQMAFGATRDTMFAYEEGRITALEGRALGVQVDFAPVLDVNNNAANPVINTRSYGEDPRLVAAMGRSFIRGAQAYGMIATGKHFPGHGDTEINSHLALPIVRASRARLDSVELVPFRAAIGAGVDAIMTFHGSMPALDSSGVPATLSPPVLTGLLRGDMQFHGLIISDAMDMAGGLAHFGLAEAVKRAVAAGVDVVIQPTDATQAIDAIVAGVQDGRYTESRIDSSVRRLLALKHQLGLDRQRYTDLDSLRAIVGDSANQAVARDVAERSITVVKDSLHALPLGRLTRAARVLSITIAHRPDLGAGVAFGATLRQTFPNLRTEFIDADNPGDVPWRLMSEADSADVTIVGSYVGQFWAFTTVAVDAPVVTFIQQLVQRGRRPIVVAFGNPYLQQQVPSVPAYVIAWGGFPVSQQAAARAILGAIPVTGTLPISIPPYATFGAGIAIPARP